MGRSSRDMFRYFLKDKERQEVDFNNTDKNRGIAPPPLEKPIPARAQRIDLIPAEKLHDTRPRVFVGNLALVKRLAV